MDEIIRFGVSLPANLLRHFDKNIEEKGYTSRSEAIRNLIRQSLVDSQWENSSSETAAAVVLVYDHHNSSLTDQLTKEQHVHHRHVIATMHSHLDHDNCIEVVLLRGPAKTVKSIAQKLSSAKHIKFNRFVPATSGREI